MPRLLLAALTALTLAGPLAAQDMTFPSGNFPQPGTFCGAFQLCQPLVTRGAGQ